jgi:hypothetical protein
MGKKGASIKISRSKTPTIKINKSKTPTIKISSSTPRVLVNTIPTKVKVHKVKGSSGAWAIIIIIIIILLMIWAASSYQVKIKI